MLENKKPANKKVVKHIDSCLSCYSCMTTCPSGVNYMHLIDHGRNYVEETYKRPFFDRLFRNVLSFVLPRPKVFLFLAYLTKLIKPFSFLLPTWPEKLIPHVTKLAINSFSCVNAPSQFAGIAALDGSDDAIHLMMEKFDQRRKLIHKGLPMVHGKIILFHQA